MTDKISFKSTRGKACSVFKNHIDYCKIPKVVIWWKVVDFLSFYSDTWKSMSLLYMKTKTHLTTTTSNNYDVIVVSSNVYTDTSVLELLVLKTKDHISSFKNVMKNFEIEMVNIFWKSLLWKLNFFTIFLLLVFFVIVFHRWHTITFNHMKARFFLSMFGEGAKSVVDKLERLERLKITMGCMFWKKQFQTSIEFLIQKVMEKVANCLKNIWNSVCFEFEKIQFLISKNLHAFLSIIFWHFVFYVEIEKLFPFLQEKMSFIYMINRNVGEYDVRECWAYDYTDPIIQSILFLSFGEHSPFFRHVMKNFKIERVIFPFSFETFKQVFKFFIWKLKFHSCLSFRLFMDDSGLPWAKQFWKPFGGNVDYVQTRSGRSECLEKRVVEETIWKK